MAKFPWQYVNINGIPTIKTQTVVVSDTAVTFKFAPDFDGRPFRDRLCAVDRIDYLMPSFFLMSLGRASLWTTMFIVL